MLSSLSRTKNSAVSKCTRFAFDFTFLQSQLRRCSSALSSSNHSLEDRVKSLTDTVQRQQVAILALTRKLPKVTDPSASAASPERQASSTTTIEQEQQQNRKLVELEKAFSQLQRRIDTLERSFTSKSSHAAAEYKSSVLQHDTGRNSNNNNNNNSSEQQLQISELRNRIAQLESRQAVLKLAHRRQDMPSASRPSHNAKSSSSSSSSSAVSSQLVVSMDAGVDGTPRLATCQVLVFHPTANAAEIRELMESVGPVVSCLRRPGVAAGGKSSSSSSSSSTSPSQSRTDSASNSGRKEDASDSRPCFVVSFQTTVDAVRAIETLNGVQIRKTRVSVEPFVIPEQQLAAAATASTMEDGDSATAAAAVVGREGFFSFASSGDDADVADSSNNALLTDDDAAIQDDPRG